MHILCDSKKWNILKVYEYRAARMYTHNRVNIKNNCGVVCILKWYLATKVKNFDPNFATSFGWQNEQREIESENENKSNSAIIKWISYETMKFAIILFGAYVWYHRIHIHEVSNNNLNIYAQGSWRKKKTQHKNQEKNKKINIIWGLNLKMAEAYRWGNAIDSTSLMLLCA